MVAAGHEVDTVALDTPGTSLDPRLNSRTVYQLGPPHGKYSFAIRLEPWLREHGLSYDIVIVHGMWQYHGYCVAKVARSTGMRYVVFLHGMLDPWFGKRYPWKHLKKWLYWPWGEYRVLRDARFVLFTTAEEMRLARKSFWLYKAREKLVGYGIKARDIPPGAARETFLSIYPHLRHTRNLLFLSRIHPKKGCDMLLEAFSCHARTDPTLHLVIAGPDGVGWQSQLTNQATRLGINDRVTFTGMVKDEMKWGAYDAADVFILPSHQENFGIVVAEALASGLPVLTTFQVNIWREIEEAGAGIIAEDTQQGTNKLLERWLELSSNARRAMRDKTIQCFETNFELNTVTAQLLSAIREAAQPSPRGVPE